MSTLGEIRDGIRSTLGEIPARVQVQLVGGDYDEGIEKFSVVLLVGEDSPENENVLDELISRDGPVLTAFALNQTLGDVVQTAAVRKHSGHRAFKQPDGTLLLGTELLLEISR
jgi:hypothetical protein